MQLLLDNAVSWGCENISESFWLSTDVASGTISAGSSEDITVTTLPFE